jgi:hypothetical protein
MGALRELRWPLVLGLGALALVRPAVSVLESQLGVEDPPAVPIAITIVVTVIWVAVVGLRRITQPVLTLLFAGLTYGVLAIVLSGVLSLSLDNELQGPLANPVAIVPVLVINALWGLGAGALAWLVQRRRGSRPR